ncbi:glutathione peroxidase [Paucibacter sp. B2R-40]|uniref:glutathione peroxidase n=1 Tax=Paucibacter sp. B2R-40 TaxID=2893554 RepID=UPI0021E3DB90|nr:glutathione peroxidase [Paucibacter sp. B2R-40]MCV2353576.1 glutathione peroxidase [Paucibacter sp. B2R-40]
MKMIPQLLPVSKLSLAGLLAGAMSSACFAASAPALPNTAACPALLQREMPRLQDEKPLALCQYAGKVVMVVNTASFCGFTPQYKALETLAARYADRGLVVLGFPSNDFGSQEPGSNKEIAEFCENTFNVKFPMFAKSVVKSGKPDTNPLFADLIKRSGSEPKWNFHKYLISRDGQQVVSFWSTTDPLSKGVTDEVERLLSKP